MERWAVVCLILCGYGLFKEIRPSEPYLTEYLEGPWVNLTKSEVNNEIYPVWTYSYLVLLILVFLLTDLVRYKPVIVLEGAAYITTWGLLIWGRGVTTMQFMQFTYGVATSTEVAYYTYIYSVVQGDVYQKVTGFARSAILSGRFCSGVLSQVLISTGALNFQQLNYISLTTVSIAFIFAIFLPRAPASIYFHQNGENEQGRLIQYKQAFQQIFRELKHSYSNPLILKWSIWWAFATCINFQVGNYIQPLWETISPTWSNHSNSTSGEMKIYNGAVEATHTLLSAVAAFGFGYINLPWNVIGEIVLGTVSLANAVILGIMAVTSKIWLAYITYIIFRLSYQVLITIISYQVAKDLPKDSYGLIFGFNTFFALLFETILTVTVADKVGLHLDPRNQFKVYSAYFGVLAIAFIILGIITLLKNRTRRRNTLLLSDSALDAEVH